MADSNALYAVGGGNTDLVSSVTTNFIPYYLDKKYRREDTSSVLCGFAFCLFLMSVFVVLVALFDFLSLLCPCLHGDDVLCRLLSCLLSPVCFPCFSPNVFPVRFGLIPSILRPRLDL